MGVARRPRCNRIATFARFLTGANLTSLYITLLTQDACKHVMPNSNSLRLCPCVAQACGMLCGAALLASVLHYAEDDANLAHLYQFIPQWMRTTVC